jgi:hypothetical protein
MLSLLIGCIQFFIFKIVGHIFWHRVMAVTKKLWDTQILAHILGGTCCDLH